MLHQNIQELSGNPTLFKWCKSWTKDSTTIAELETWAEAWRALSYEAHQRLQQHPIATNIHSITSKYSGPSHSGHLWIKDIFYIVDTGLVLIATNMHRLINFWNMDTPFILDTFCSPRGDNSPGALQAPGVTGTLLNTGELSYY